MKIGNGILSVILLVLFVSVAGNIIQYNICWKKPEIVEVVTRDTITELDTVFLPKFGEAEILDPVPVFIDTFKNLTVYRDTLIHQYGWIATTEKVRGDLLSKGIQYKFNIPEYYKTRTITNTVTRTVRNDLFFATGGLMADFSGGITPVIGGTYIWNSHRNIVGLNIGLNRQISVSAGFVLWR